MQAETSALWARILKEKYDRGRDLTDLIGRRVSCSNALRGILEHIQLSNQGLGVAIGDGRQTQFWHHKWLDGERLLDKAIGVVPENHYHKTVSDYWRIGAGWDWPQLSSLLPPSTLQRIASYELISEAVGDKVIWAADSFGKSTIKLALKLLRPTDSHTEADWKWMWKIRVPQRIKLFLWLVLHRKILTNAERFKRQMIPSPQCDLCLGELEDLEHISRSCPNARAVWQELSIEGLCYTAGEEEFSKWVRQNLHGTHDDPDWSTKFMITLWYIWKWRCKQCFNTDDESPREKGTFLLHKSSEILNALHQDDQHQGKRKSEYSEVWTRWESPLEGWVALNTDGAAKGNPGLAGAGGVIRDHKGEWILGFSENSGCCSPLKAEIKAILRGLQLVKGTYAQKIWLQVDSKVVVNTLLKEQDGHPKYSFLLNQCKDMITWEEWEVKITHCFRETNQVADILAKMGSEEPLGMKHHRVPPVGTRDALFADSVGAFWPGHNNQ